MGRPTPQEAPRDATPREPRGRAAAPRERRRIRDRRTARAASILRSPDLLPDDGFGNTAARPPPAHLARFGPRCRTPALASEHTPREEMTVADAPELTVADAARWRATSPSMSTS